MICKLAAQVLFRHALLLARLHTVPALQLPGLVRRAAAVLPADGLLPAGARPAQGLEYKGRCLWPLCDSVGYTGMASAEVVAYELMQAVACACGFE